MVLILLSTPNHLNPLWPATPRSMDTAPRSPQTPLTPSPSFFAILSPIFTADDNLPISPAGLLQVSPGIIPPETPPPWLLGPRSPAASSRPTISRSTSYYEAPTPNLPRAVLGDRLIQLPQQRQRPAFPSTTYSFTAGHAQAFRPPPPLALKRVNTEPIKRGPFSPLKQAIHNATTIQVPELSIRPPSREELRTKNSSEENQDSKVELLTISMSTESEPSSPMECESMDVPILFEAPPPTPRSGVKTMSPSPHWQTISKVIPQSISQSKHSRSPSAPAAPRSDNITISLRMKTQPLSKPLQKPLNSTHFKSHRVSMSMANLQQFDKEMGHSHLPSRCELR